MYRYLLIVIVVFSGCKNSEKNHQIENESIVSDLKNEVLSQTRAREKNVKELNVWALKGKVKRLVEYSCNNESDCRITDVFEFTPDNVLLKKMSWVLTRHPEDPDYISISEINDDGFVIKTISEGNTIIKSYYETVYSYNEDNFVEELIQYNKGELDYRVVHVYDEYNNEIKYSNFGKNNELRYYSEYEYDNQNRLIKHLSYDGNKKLQKRFVTEYKESKKDWKKVNEYDAHGNLDKTSIREEEMKYMYYPEKSKLYPNIEYHTNGKIKSWNYLLKNKKNVYQTYSITGTLIDRKVSNSNDSRNTRFSKYRIDGELVEVIEKGTDVYTGRYFEKTIQYKYDYKGNVVEEYTFGTKGTELLKREYEYY